MTTPLTLPTIREARAIDMPDIASMFGQLYADVSEMGGVQASRDTQALRLETALHGYLDKTIYSVCLVAGSPAQAFTLWAVTEESHPTLGCVAEALATYVRPGWRKLGLASRLYRVALGQLAHMGVTTLVALTETANQGGQALLKRQGFEPAQVIYTRRLDPDGE